MNSPGSGLRQVIIGGIVRADENVIERKSLPKDGVHAFQFSASDTAVGKTRLIAGGDEQQA